MFFEFYQWCYLFILRYEQRIYFQSIHRQTILKSVLSFECERASVAHDCVLVHLYWHPIFASFNHHLINHIPFNWV